MKIPLPSLIERMRGSLWFVPTVMTVGAVVLAIFLIGVDQKVNAEVVRTLGWIYSGSPEGAREMLGTIAASMITVAGVVFSVTVVALSLASQQFGPRMLRNFMQDRGNQIVLGTFIATFIYCLLILRTVRGADGAAFVPHISVTVGVLLAGASLGVLIYFIHHFSSSIQADHVIGEIAEELDRNIEHLYPEDLGAQEYDPPPQALPDVFRGGVDVVRSSRHGFIQAINRERLVELAKEQNVIIRLTCAPGEFLFRGMAVVETAPSGKIDEKFAEGVRDTLVTGRSRTPTQDILFPIHQLVELAVRSLSPSINDPFTAVSALYRLGNALSLLASKRMPSPLRSDDEGRLRVIARYPTYDDLIDAALHQIRREGRRSPFVLEELLRTIAAVLDVTKEPSRRATLLRHAVLVRNVILDALEEPEDRDALLSLYRARIAFSEDDSPRDSRIAG